MPEDVAIAPASLNDLEGIKALLLENDLPTAGVDEHWKTFLVAHDGGRMVGCAGAEQYPSAALLRSIAVDAAHRSQGLGRKLVRQMLDRLASRGIRDFYLLTTTAEDYFAKRGFTKIDRNEVAPDVLASVEFRDACPSSAVCMRLRMLT